MAKKKQNKTQQLSPEKYIITKARSLPIEKCLINKDWKTLGEASIIVERQHKSGNRTLGIYLVDTFCLGMKSAYYMFNQDNIEYESIEERYSEAFEVEEIPYVEVHNIIYGAISYAEECGFEPVKEFAVAKYILEEDTEDIPLIEYEFGKDGKPFLMVNTQLEASKLLPVLIENVGSGNFDYYIADNEDDENEDEHDPYTEMNHEFDTDSFLNLFNKDHLVSTIYNYQYPDYPTELIYKHHELDAFFEPQNNFRLDKSTIDSILSLNREELLDDLNNILLYEIGRTCNGSDELLNEPETSVLTHVLFFLGELRATEKLDTVLEILRQSKEFKEFHFGDYISDILPLTLYYVTGSNYNRLFEYMKEPSLYVFFRVLVPGAMAYVAINQPEKREEVIRWFKELLDYYLQNTDKPEVFDSNLAGMIMNELIDIEARELLPDIEALYNTGLVDLFPCGDYDEVETEINYPVSRLSDYTLLDIYERYKLVGS